MPSRRDSRAFPRAPGSAVPGFHMPPRSWRSVVRTFALLENLVLTRAPLAKILQRKMAEEVAEKLFRS